MRDEEKVKLFLADILENSSQPFASGFPDGRVMYFNKAACKLTGYTKEELNNITWSVDLTPPKWREYEANILKELDRTGEPQCYEKEYIRKDGTIIPIELLVHRVCDTNSNVIYFNSFITDISKRKQMEEELRRYQEDRFTVVFNSCPSGMVICDLNGKCIEANASFERITGYNRHEVLGTTICDLGIVERKEVKCIKKVFKKAGSHQPAVINGKVRNGESRIYKFSVEKIKFGGNEYFLCVFDDVTEFEVLQQELKNSNELFKDAVDFCPFPMSITTIDEGKVIELNQSFLETFGCNREEVIGDTSLNLNFYSEPELRSKLIKELLQNGYFKNIEGGIQTKSGVKRIALLSGRLIDYQGKACMLSAVNDITELNLFHKEMARLNVLNAVGQMASGIGHEIRNPMTSVKGFLQLFANKETDSKKKEYFDLMIEELDRANSIITEFLSLANDRMVKLKPASLNQVINAIYPLLSSDAMKQDKRIMLNKGSIPNIPVNEKELRQLIINLVRNAIEASLPSGIVTLNTYVSGGEVVLSVDDEGTGIPPEIYDKIGTPFVTTKDNGTGLGLSICYSIAYKHNAKIDIKTSSTGTSVYVRFKTASVNRTSESI